MIYVGFILTKQLNGMKKNEKKLKNRRKRYFLTSDGQEIKVGDTIKISKEVIIDKDTLEDMVKEGIVMERPYYPASIDFYIKLFAEEMDIEVVIADALLEKLAQKMPMICVGIMLKVISEYVNQDNRLQDYPTVYLIDKNKGVPFEAESEGLTPMLAWFPNKGTAELAIHILKPFLKEIYGEQKDTEC